MIDIEKQELSVISSATYPHKRNLEIEGERGSHAIT